MGSAHELAPPASLETLEVTEELGRGSSAAVLRATESSMGGVVVKLGHGADDVDALAHEARVLLRGAGMATPSPITVGWYRLTDATLTAAALGARHARPALV